jgi:hypothetical protein
MARPRRRTSPNVSIVSRRGARVGVSGDSDKTHVSIGVPRHGCGGAGHGALRAAAWESLRSLGRELIADGLRVRFERDERTGRRRENSPDEVTIHAAVDSRGVAAMLARRFDSIIDRLTRSIGTPIPRAVAVPIEEVVAEARRQEQFQLPRRTGMYEGRPPQTQEAALRMAKGTTRIIEREGRDGGGYVLVNVPIDWLRTSPAHVDVDRQARQANIGGTDDPAFSTSYYGVEVSDDAESAVGPCLGLENGNNRVFFARNQGRTHYPVFVTRAAWDTLTSAVRDARREANDAPCEARASATNGRDVRGRRHR